MATSGRYCYLIFFRENERDEIFCTTVWQGKSKLKIDILLVTDFHSLSFQIYCTITNIYVVVVLWLYYTRKPICTDWISLKPTPIRHHDRIYEKHDRQVALNIRVFPSLIKSKFAHIIRVLYWDISFTEWNYIIKYIFARIAVRRWKSRFPSKFVVSEKSKEGLTEGWDGISIRASAPDGATVLFGIRKICGRKPMAEVTLYVKLADGTSYKLPCKYLQEKTY